MNLFCQLAAAGAGTAAFSFLFGVPSRCLVTTGVTGMLGWLVYSLAGMGGFGNTMSTFFAAAFVIFLSRIFAVRKKAPVTVFLITGIFPLVPGAGIYWASYYLVTGQLALACESGFSALKAAVAIVLGIMFVFEIPQKCFEPSHFTKQHFYSKRHY